MKEDMKTKYGPWCLVAGAAEGLGEAFAQALAKRGMNLIMVDVQKDRLDSLATQLERSHGIRVKTLMVDLARGESLEEMMELIRETHCRLLIYNAAFSRVQKFVDYDPAMLDSYVQVNMRTPLHLIHAFCKLFSSDQEQRKGILLMSSLAGSWGTQLLAPYGGTKAFNHILAESLHYELKEKGFDVLACISGAISTPAYLSSLPPGKKKARPVMDPDAVVEASLRAMGHKPFVIPGTKNKLIYFLMTRVLPRRISVRLMSRAVKGMYE